MSINDREVLVRKGRRMRRDRQVNLLPPNRESLASGSSRVTLFFVTSEGGYGEN